MSSSQDTPQVVVEGQVKWFDPGRGFGFVVSDEGGPDILLHVNVIRSYGQSSVLDGSRVRLSMHKTARGLQATELLEVTPPETVEADQTEEMTGLSAEELAALPLLPARIKWYDKAKGFGFAHVFGDDRDIFVHVEVLRRAGLGEPATGEALAIKVVDGRRGRMAAVVASWEAAL